MLDDDARIECRVLEQTLRDETAAALGLDDDEQADLRTLLPRPTKTLVSS